MRSRLAQVEGVEDGVAGVKGRNPITQTPAPAPEACASAEIVGAIAARVVNGVAVSARLAGVPLALVARARGLSP